MSPIRLLVIADAKMLPALAAGLREAGKFEVTPVALADGEAAKGSAQGVDAVVVFYGAAGAPLPAALQAMAPHVRPRGARIVAVLQRNQAPMRDECFRAGASDVLFMPLPKEQFVARLADTVELVFAPVAAAKAPASISTRTASSKLEHAAISSVGIDALKELPLKAGDTVRIAWDSFQQWGLVVHGAPSAQVRFAGLSAEEETKIRTWIEGAAAAPPPAPAPAPRVEAAPPPQSTGGARAAPTAGPPPGYAERKPVRPATRPPPASAGGVATPTAVRAAAPAPAPQPSAPAPQRPVMARPAAASVAVPTSDEAAAKPLFDEPPAAAPAEPEDLPTWPTPVDAPLYKELLMNLLREEGIPEGLTPSIVASAKKITSIMSGGEREALGEAGPDSPIADALSARIALDSSTIEGAKLAVRVRTAAVDAAAVAALTKAADDSAGRLQKSANGAIAKGEVEELQLITAVSASLSRDLLNFKEMADRLRGVGSGPRLGLGSLDPDVVRAGHTSRPRPLAAAQPAHHKAELRDFRGLDARPTRWKPVLMGIMVLGAAAAAVNGFYLSVPHHAELSAAASGEGVARVDVSGNAALVTVTPEWIAHVDARLPQLVGTLRKHEVLKAALLLPSGGTVGLLDVATGKISGMPLPRAFEATPPAPPADPRSTQSASAPSAAEAAH